MASMDKTDETVTRDQIEAPEGPQKPPEPLPRRETRSSTRSRISGPRSAQDDAPTPDGPLTVEEGAALMGPPVQHGGTPPTTAVEDEAATDEARAAAHFASDAKTHTMTVHREDGPFRHISFTGLSGLSRVTLVTWPYNLLVAGSHGSHHFERYGSDTEDMFNWLRGGRVNADSWASKLINGRDSVTEYSRQLLVAEVGERVQEALADGWAPEGLVEAVAEQILGSHLLENEGTALQLVDEFQHGEQHRAECSCGVTSRLFDDYHSAARWNATTHLGKGPEHQVRVRQTGGFDFSDIYDWRIRKLNYHYLWTCHAAVWAIGQYDAAKQAAEPFFQPDRVYAHGPWQFRCDSATTHPDSGARTALGWFRFRDQRWRPHHLTNDEWADGWTEVTEAAEVSS